MTNRLLPQPSFQDALEEHFTGIVVPFQRRLHVARRRAKALKPYVEWIAKTRLLHGIVLLGTVLRSESYDSYDEVDSSERVIQAALLIPRGIGILVWDSEEIASLKYQDRTLESEAWLAHVPFEFCSPEHQALLVDQILVLADRLMRRLRRELSDPLYPGEEV